MTQGISQDGVFVARQAFVLASGSPRRRELLASAGLTFTVAASDCEEPAPMAGESPAAYAVRMACDKACDVAARFPEAVVLGADTVVALGGRIMGKPVDAADARAMLGALCGGWAQGMSRDAAVRTHEVVTGCCLLLPGGAARPDDASLAARWATSTEVDMGLQAEAVIAAYVATGEPMDKAGAYAIQGQGAFLVRGVRGSYTNVVGLPLARVLEVLQEWRVVVPRRRV
ncbi:MAG: nucleoside triphosphate pyrophosphatase [Desulfovibrionaceae bacterium]